MSKNRKSIKKSFTESNDDEEKIGVKPVMAESASGVQEPYVYQNDYTRTSAVKKRKGASTVPAGYTRAHFYPVAALSALLERELKEKPKKQVVESLATDEDNEMIKLHLNKMWDYLSAVYSTRNCKETALADAVPYIVIPTEVERIINETVKEFAKLNSIPVDGGEPVIKNESEFATQYPELYTSIFNNILDAHSSGLLKVDVKLTPQDCGKIKDGIEKSVKELKSLSDACKRLFDAVGIPHSPALFGINPLNKPKDKSGVEIDKTITMDDFTTYLEIRGYAIPKPLVLGVKYEEPGPANDAVSPDFSPEAAVSKAKGKGTKKR